MLDPRDLPAQPQLRLRSYPGSSRSSTASTDENASPSLRRSSSGNGRVEGTGGGDLSREESSGALHMQGDVFPDRTLSLIGGGAEVPPINRRDAPRTQAKAQDVERICGDMQKASNLACEVIRREAVRVGSEFPWPADLCAPTPPGAGDDAADNLLELSKYFSGLSHAMDWMVRSRSHDVGCVGGVGGGGSPVGGGDTHGSGDGGETKTEGRGTDSDSGSGAGSGPVGDWEAVKVDILDVAWDTHMIEITNRYLELPVASGDGADRAHPHGPFTETRSEFNTYQDAGTGPCTDDRLNDILRALKDGPDAHRAALLTPDGNLPPPELTQYNRVIQGRHRIVAHFLLYGACQIDVLRQPKAEKKPKQGIDNLELQEVANDARKLATFLERYDADRYFRGGGGVSEGSGKRQLRNRLLEIEDLYLEGYLGAGYKTGRILKGLREIITAGVNAGGVGGGMENGSGEGCDDAAQLGYKNVQQKLQEALRPYKDKRGDEERENVDLRTGRWGRAYLQKRVAGGRTVFRCRITRVAEGLEGTAEGWGVAIGLGTSVGVHEDGEGKEDGAGGEEGGQDRDGMGEGGGDEGNDGEGRATGVNITLMTSDMKGACVGDEVYVQLMDYDSWPLAHVANVCASVDKAGADCVVDEPSDNRGRVFQPRGRVMAFTSMCMAGKAAEMRAPSQVAFANKTLLRFLRNQAYDCGLEPYAHEDTGVKLYRACDVAPFFPGMCTEALLVAYIRDRKDLSESKEGEEPRIGLVDGGDGVGWILRVKPSSANTRARQGQGRGGCGGGGGERPSP